MRLDDRSGRVNKVRTRKGGCGINHFELHALFECLKLNGTTVVKILKTWVRLGIHVNFMSKPIILLLF